LADVHLAQFPNCFPSCLAVFNSISPRYRIGIFSPNYSGYYRACMNTYSHLECWQALTFPDLLCVLPIKVLAFPRPLDVFTAKASNGTGNPTAAIISIAYKFLIFSMPYLAHDKKFKKNSKQLLISATRS